MPFDRFMSQLSDFRHLKIGRRYQVVKAFADFDGDEHPVGETWRFEGHSFLPYDDGLSLYVTRPLDITTADAAPHQIRMRWTPEDQGEVIDHLDAYICPVA